MKIKLFINIIFFSLAIINSSLRAETIFFDSKNIKVENEGEMIFATEGTARIPTDNIIIQGEKFIYDKSISELTILDNVKYFDNENNVYIESQKLIYNQIENIIFSKNDTFIETDNSYEINSADVIYNRNSKIISSKNLTTVEDTSETNLFLRKVWYLKRLRKLYPQKMYKLQTKN